MKSLESWEAVWLDHTSIVFVKELCQIGAEFVHNIFWQGPLPFMQKLMAFEPSINLNLTVAVG
jgi:hypothetical protein